jgi:predicted methyltransferase
MAMRIASISLLASPLVLTPTAGAFGESASPSVDAAGVRALLEARSRPEADRARDEGRKPADVVAFLGIEPGMTVIDLIAASGYYTEVLALAVGPDGRVYAQNNRFVLEMREGANDKAMTGRLADGRLPNVERLDREMDALGLEPGSMDAALTALNFHDIYNGRGPDAAQAFLATVYALLAPGGVFGLIDHSGGVADDEALHRIEESQAIAAAQQAGFSVEAASDVLRNPDDDRTGGVFDPALRGHTDRFVLRLRKPATEPDARPD